ncbi:glycosyltransferase family 4 protein [bacterium]|nr:glycosyltransferase family 4 protein [bacterium]
MKKILIFSLAYFPKHVGGAEVAIKEITDRIHSSEFEFHMVTLRFDPTLPRFEKVGNVSVHRIGFAKSNPSMADLKKFPLFLNKYYFQIAAPLYAIFLHSRHRFDVIWAMMAHSSGVPAAIFKLFHPEVKFVLTLQEGDPPEYIERRALPVWPLFKRAFTSADAIQCISTFLAKWAKRMGYSGEPVVIPNAVDTKLFSRAYTEEELHALEKKLGKKEGDIFLITTSRLVYKNAVDDVVRALPLLPQNIKFLVIGIGPDEEMLRSFAKSEKVEERVMFLGEIKNSELPKYLQASNIFIRPSRSEGMGISFVEAFAAGIPVIATQEGGIADFLFDPEKNPDKPPTGRAVDANSPEAIARAIELVLTDKETTRNMVENARTLVFTAYDWNTIAEDMREKVFKYVLRK